MSLSSIYDTVQRTHHEIKKAKARGDHKAASEALHSTTGMGLGMCSSAAAGAAVGSVIPGVGTVVGCFVGGVIGLVNGVNDKTAADNVKTAWKGAKRLKDLLT